MGKPVSDDAVVDKPSCPICNTALDRRTVVLCRQCASPHHRRCWSYNRGCGLFGCRCRVFVSPPPPMPTTREPPIAFSRHAVPLHGIYGGTWAVLIMLCLFARPALIPALVAAGLFPLLLEVRHTLDEEKGSLVRRRLLGPLVFWRRRLLGLEQVEELELRARPSADRPQAPCRRWQVWLRDRRERSWHLGDLRGLDGDEALALVQAAAERLDTVVSLPRDMGGDLEMPPGLRATLEALEEGD